MGWDDSDGEAEEEIDFEKQLAEKKKEEERRRRREAGEDSESEKEEAPKVDAKPKPKPKPKAKAEPKEEEKQMTAEERKLLQRKREEEQSAKLAADLFSGCDLADEAREVMAKKQQEEDRKKEAAANKPTFIVIDSFDKVELKVQKDVDNLLTTIATKINAATAKGAAAFFCLNILKQLEASLNDEELASVDQAIAELMKAKAEQKAEALTVEKKANTKLSKTTKFNTHSEWQDVYGGGEGDEDWTPEEWAAWQAEQEGGQAWTSTPAAAKGAKW